MREIRSWMVIACALAACKGQSGSSAKHQGSDEPGETEKMEGEISVSLGDCAPAGTPFMAGAEPQAFKPEELVTPATKLYATAADGGDVLAAYYANEDVYGGLLGSEAGEMAGGFGYGRSGFGPGGGGQGWGTIGTGKYGTIGHGSGTGYGIGGGRMVARNNIDVPSVTIGQPVVQGDLDKAIIRRYIKRNIQRIQYCYEKQLLADPTLVGTVTVSFVIAPTGSVTKSDGSGVQKDVSSCVADMIRGIEFPKPAGGGVVQVTYPFNFTPGASGKKPVVIKPVAPKPAPSDKPSKTETAALGKAEQAGLVSLISTAVPTSKPYTPGAASPLADLRIALVDCFRRQDKHHAAAVFDLAPGSITVHGIDHPAFAKCLAELGPQVKVTTPVRCSATFGSAVASTLPSIDITADAITMNGQKVTEPAAVMGGTPEQWWKVQSVFDVAQAHVKATLASKDALTMHGPLAVRPLPATPMKIVTKLVHTLVAAGEAPVLAAQRNGNWQLVRNYPLPMLPVPTGTGGSWDSESGNSPLLEPDDKPHLSVLVDSKDVWVGVSPKNEGKRVPFGKLKEVLVEHKASGAFADRDDIQIAGADDVPYSRVVEAIDMASGAGFRAWSLTSPIGLASRPPDDAAAAGSAAAGSAAAGSAAP